MDGIGSYAAAMNSYRVGPQTQRLDHRAMTVDDAEAFYALNSHPEVMRFTGEPPILSVDDARRALDEYPDFDTVGYGRWGCVLRETQSLIGFCGLKYLPELDAVDVGYRFLPEHWGQGLATEACAASLKFGLDTLRLRRIIGLVLPENAASIRVLEKCGMRRNGTIEYDGHDALLYDVCRPS